jgi:dolichol-phosphate mannosyltransferase
MKKSEHKIAVVIPSYKVINHIAQVIERIPKFVHHIYVVDDCCPDMTGDHVLKSFTDSRIKVIKNPRNLGVGGAVLAGYKAAICDDIDIVVKIDGDGQMDPGLIPLFIHPIINGEADYTKGNRFYELEHVKSMPLIRLLGNSILSFLTKLSSGYWDLFDPTNGYTAIHCNVASQLPFTKISNRYFFETDMLFRLNTLRAVIVDIPMEASYGNEVSNLKIKNIVGEFMIKHFINTIKRIFYNYYLRDLSIASFELPIGIFLLAYGIIFGGFQWHHAVVSKLATPSGTVMLAALPSLVGLQLLLAYISYDISQVPKIPINQKLPKRKLINDR